MFTTVFGIISTITSIVGVVAFFTEAIPLLCICAVISLINSLVQVTVGQQNNLGSEFLTVVVCLIISFFVDTAWYIVIAFGLCIVEAVMGVFGLIAMLIAALSGRRNNYWR